MLSSTFKIYIYYIEITLLILVAAVYLTNTIKKFMPEKLYEFIQEHKDTIVGLYYVFLAYKVYEVYRNNKIVV